MEGWINGQSHGQTEIPACGSEVGFGGSVAMAQVQKEASSTGRTTDAKTDRNARRPGKSSFEKLEFGELSSQMCRESSRSSTGKETVRLGGRSTHPCTGQLGAARRPPLDPSATRRTRARTHRGNTVAARVRVALTIHARRRDLSVGGVARRAGRDAGEGCSGGHWSGSKIAGKRAHRWAELGSSEATLRRAAAAAADAVDGGI